MHIYHLVNHTNVPYDSYDAFVIIATSEEKARAIANEESADEGRLWGERELASCTVIGRARSGASEGIVVGSFNAG